MTARAAEPGPIVEVRPVQASDADVLLRWANDPTTRAMSFHPERIDRRGHEAWLAARLASATTRFYVGSVGGRPIGQVRFERSPDDDVEVSIAVAPESRGRGIGGALLAAGIAASQAPPALGGRIYTARIRSGNAASVAMFTTAGFVARPDAVGSGPDELIFRLGIGSPPAAGSAASDDVIERRRPRR